MDNSTCTVADCERPLHVKKRGFCQYHYLQWWKNPEGSSLRPAPVQHPCHVCEKPTTNPKYCGDTCRNAGKWADIKGTARYERQKAQKRAAYIPRERAPRPRTQKTCAADACGRAAVAKGLCAMHYRQERKRLGLWSRSPADHWATPARMARMVRRRAIIRTGVKGGDLFTIEDLLERDNGICGLCQDPIPKDATWPSPEYPTVDHILPLSRGGAHVMDNAQPAHFLCNVRAGAKDPVEVS